MHKIDISKGKNIDTLSRQWASRPDDQRFTTLGELRAQVAEWADTSFTSDILPGKLHITATEGDDLTVGWDGNQMDLTNYSFHQVARMAGAPAYYLRNLPAPLAALNLNYGLRAAEQRNSRFYMRDNMGDLLLRGITSPKYGRIYDRDVVDAVMTVAGNGDGEAHWKVPGCIDWTNKHGIHYNPNVDVTKENTTLYASDRDLFLFLVDDLRPIEVGKLADGSPDLMFRGFYVWNSEVGERTFGVATMYLRGVCQNRNLWGVEGFNEITFKHTSGAPDRFMTEAAPLLETFSHGFTEQVVAGVAAAKQAKVSANDEERIEFLGKLGFSERQAKELIATAIAEEGRPQESVWDHACSITAAARKQPFQDARLDMERVAGKLLDKVKV